MAKLVLPVSVETIATRHDGSVKIVMGTYELNTQSAVKLFDLRKSEALMYLSSDNISQEELDALDGFKLDAEKTDGKTPSQRLRAVLYVYWKQHKQKDIEFDIFYLKYMNRTIDRIKDKLDAETY
jgi:hypothetical protein|tara:strand:+ start:2190 stop:2564 length:375 start_codon:yes stop_codon:yes gene_type:complete